MKPALVLLTSDRIGYTRTTLATLAQHNDLSRFTLLHGDDGSVEREVFPLVRSYGFKTVSASTIKEGWRVSRLKLLTEAERRKAPWVLYLENDQEWVRSFPWALFDLVQRDSRIYCLRLQGEFKDRERLDAHMVHHKVGLREKPAKWKAIKAAPEPAQIGEIHWSAQPSITRTFELMALHRYSRQAKGSLTARVLENCTFHIGAERTPRVKVA